MGKTEVRERALNLKWHPGISDPTVAGWLCVLAYVVAAAMCLRASFPATGPGSRRAWQGLALTLVFLGINKQLDFQTWLIELGRNAARSEGWYEHRRMVQALFTAVIILIAAILLFFLTFRARHFLRENPLAIVGASVLLGFIVIRTSTLNHVLGAMGDRRWAWILEIAGNVCISFAALKALERDRKR